eukprot:TRINITY_DN20729_c0_g1_i1.p1 TRINITY_DN20729_c0_g1~~TRINITY_DN20729_c0_g1_i1.p1  ORF type:complete len:388 (+),score=50.83 TRINITY_DN20729_c0_g1_i1:75-1238(+)
MTFKALLAAAVRRLRGPTAVVPWRKAENPHLQSGGALGKLLSPGGSLSGVGKHLRSLRSSAGDLWRKATYGNVRTGGVNAFSLANARAKEIAGDLREDAQEQWQGFMQRNLQLRQDGNQQSGPLQGFATPAQMVDPRTGRATTVKQTNAANVLEMAMQTGSGRSHGKRFQIYELLNQVRPSSPVQLIDILDDRVPAESRSMLLTIKRREYLQQLVREHRPRVLLDLGSFHCAYSAIAAAIAGMGRTFVVTVERNAEYASWAKRCVEMVGLQHEIRVCPVDSGVLLSEQGGLGRTKFDFVFMDHGPPNFQRDVEGLLEANRFNSGAVLVSQVTIDDTFRGAQPDPDAVPLDIVGTTVADYMTWMQRHPRFKVVHCPPRSPLHVAHFLG